MEDVSRDVQTGVMLSQDSSLSPEDNLEDREVNLVFRAANLEEVASRNNLELQEGETQHILIKTRTMTYKASMDSQCKIATSF